MAKRRAAGGKLPKEREEPEPEHLLDRVVRDLKQAHANQYEKIFRKVHDLPEKEIRAELLRIHGRPAGKVADHISAGELLIFNAILQTGIVTDAETTTVLNSNIKRLLAGEKAPLKQVKEGKGNSSSLGRISEDWSRPRIIGRLLRELGKEVPERLRTVRFRGLIAYLHALGIEACLADDPSCTALTEDAESPGVAAKLRLRASRAQRMPGAPRRTFPHSARSCSSSLDSRPSRSQT